MSCAANREPSASSVRCAWITRTIQSHWNSYRTYLRMLKRFMPHTDSILLRIRPALPDQDEVSAARGPLMMETVLSALHSLHGKEGRVSLEIGTSDGKIGLFARSHGEAAALVESQLYGQYPDAEIEPVAPTLFDPKEGEVVVYADLHLAEPEVFPIKRYPQFADIVSKQTVDTIAGVTSTLVRYPKPHMRGHIAIHFEPVAGEKYRKRAIKFLPLLE